MNKYKLQFTGKKRPIVKDTKPKAKTVTNKLSTMDLLWQAYAAEAGRTKGDINSRIIGQAEAFQQLTDGISIDLPEGEYKIQTTHKARLLNNREKIYENIKNEPNVGKDLLELGDKYKPDNPSYYLDHYVASRAKDLGYKSIKMRGAGISKDLKNNVLDLSTYEPPKDMRFKLSKALKKELTKGGSPWTYYDVNESYSAGLQASKKPENYHELNQHKGKLINPPKQEDENENDLAKDIFEPQQEDVDDLLSNIDSEEFNEQNKFINELVFEPDYVDINDKNNIEEAINYYKPLTQKGEWFDNIKTDFLKTKPSKDDKIAFLKRYTEVEKKVSNEIKRLKGYLNLKGDKKPPALQHVKNENDLDLDDEKFELMAIDALSKPTLKQEEKIEIEEPIEEKPSKKKDTSKSLDFLLSKSIKKKEDDEPIPTMLKAIRPEKKIKPSKAIDTKAFNPVYYLRDLTRSNNAKIDESLTYIGDLTRTNNAKIDESLTYIGDLTRTNNAKIVKPLKTISSSENINEIYMKEILQRQKNRIDNLKSENKELKKKSEESYSLEVLKNTLNKSLDDFDENIKTDYKNLDDSFNKTTSKLEFVKSARFNTFKNVLEKGAVQKGLIYDDHMEEKDLNISTIKKELEKKEDENSLKNKKIDLLNEDIQRMSKFNDENNNKIHELRDEINKKVSPKTHNRLKKKLKSAIEEKEKIKIQYDNAVQEKAKYESELKEKDSTITTLKTDVDKFNKKKKDLEMTIKNLKDKSEGLISAAEYNKIQTQLKAAIDEKDELNKTFEESKANIQKLNKTVKDKDDSLNQLQADKKRLDSEIKKLNASLKKSKTQEDYDKLNAESNFLMKERMNLINDINTIKGQMKTKETEYNDYKTNSELTLKKIKEDNDKTINDLNQNITDLKNKLKNSKSKAEYDDLSELINEKENEFQRLTGEINRANKYATTMIKEIDDYKKKVEELTTFNKILQKEAEPKTLTEEFEPKTPKKQKIQTETPPKMSEKAKEKRTIKQEESFEVPEGYSGFQYVSKVSQLSLNKLDIDYNDYIKKLEDKGLKKTEWKIIWDDLGQSYKPQKMTKSTINIPKLTEVQKKKLIEGTIKDLTTAQKYKDDISTTKEMLSKK